MIDSNIKVHIERELLHRNLKIFVYKPAVVDGQEGIHLLKIDCDKGYDVHVWVFVPHGVPHAEFRPTYEIDELIASLLLKAMNELGVVYPDQSKTQGLYESQGKHLADLQKYLDYFMRGQQKAT